MLQLNKTAVGSVLTKRIGKPAVHERTLPGYLEGSTVGGACRNSGASVVDRLTDPLLSGASPLPQWISGAWRNGFQDKKATLEVMPTS